jgi:hypothetical protein
MFKITPNPPETDTDDVSPYETLRFQKTQQSCRPRPRLLPQTGHSQRHRPQTQHDLLRRGRHQ